MPFLWWSFILWNSWRTGSDSGLALVGCSGDGSDEIKLRDQSEDNVRERVSCHEKNLIALEHPNLSRILSVVFDPPQFFLTRQDIRGWHPLSQLLESDDLS